MSAMATEENWQIGGSIPLDPVKDCFPLYNITANSTDILENNMQFNIIYLQQNHTKRLWDYKIKVLDHEMQAMVVTGEVQLNANDDNDNQVDSQDWQDSWEQALKLIFEQSNQMIINAKELGDTEKIVIPIKKYILPATISVEEMQNYELQVVTSDLVDKWLNKQPTVEQIQQQIIYVYQFANDENFYYVYLDPQSKSIMEGGPIEPRKYYSGSSSNFNRILMCANNNYYNGRTMLYLINDIAKQEIQNQYIANQIQAAPNKNSNNLEYLEYLELMPDDLTTPDIHTMYVKPCYQICILETNNNLPVLEQGKIYLRINNLQTELSYFVCDEEGNNHTGNLLLSELNLQGANNLLEQTQNILNLIASKLQVNNQEKLSMDLTKLKYAMVNLNDESNLLQRGEFYNPEFNQQSLQKFTTLSQNVRALKKQIYALEQELSSPAYLKLISYKESLVKSVTQQHKLPLADQNGKKIDYGIQLKQPNQTVFEKGIIYLEATTEGVYFSVLSSDNTPQVGKLYGYKQ